VRTLAVHLVMFRRVASLPLSDNFRIDTLSTAMTRYAVFLSGPVGVGKTALGRALSARIGGGFVDGDDHSDRDLPWYGSILRTSRAIVQAGLAVLGDKPAVVIAYPLNCIGWIYFRRKFSEAGVVPLFVSLRASFDGIVDERRGRRFSAEEQARIRTMIAEGYGARPFGDLVVDTDSSGFAETLALLEAELQQLMRSLAISSRRSRTP
jgi:hypothetical protein